MPSEQAAAPTRDDPDSSGPDTSGPDVSGPDVSGPDTSGPDTSGPDTSGPDTSGRETGGPDVTAGVGDLAGTTGPPAWRPALAALLAWAALLPVAFLAPGWLALDPFDSGDAGMRVTVCLAAALVLGVAAIRWRGPVMVGIVAGLFASYVTFALRASLAGTPFGFGGVHGDTGRITAMAVRYTRTWATNDGIVGTPSEYPPLFPYVVGKCAVLLDVPAWRLFGPAETLLVPAALVIGFMLWTRLVPPVAALTITVGQLVVFGLPNKPHEVLALAVFVPLVLMTIARPPRGRPHWLLAGLLASLLCLTYHAWVVFSAPGLVALAWWTWRHETGRRAYLLYLAKMAAVMVLATAWYTVPYVGALLDGGQQVGDFYQSARISENPFPFLEAGLTGLVELAGLAGLLWYARTRWWAVPLLAIVAGCYGYRVLGMVRYVATGHSGLFYYTLPLIEMCLIVGAVLSTAEIVPALARRMRRPYAVGSGVVAVAALLLLTGIGYGLAWTPPARNAAGEVGSDPRGASRGLTALAHYQPLPDGSGPRSRPRTGDPRAMAESVGIVDWNVLPVDAIERLAESVRPADPRPRVVSYDEQIYAFLPWRGFIGVDRTGAQAPTRWDERHAELARLSQITDPAAFAAAGRDTAFGSIDVFVLRREGDALVWKGLRVPETIRFHPSQFASPAFVVAQSDARTFTAVRRP
ncbi:arabinofuranosyltransferase [Spirillospora sp. NPDC047279]|uniref:arabinofuranosyltransferase n=1 Tax=Spirillospora sp. NPDC047279 TaxID=3155478 RepID=UPI0033EDE3A1